MGSGRDGSVIVQTAPGLPNGRPSLDKPSMQHGGFGAAARASIEATLRRASGEPIVSSEPPAQPALRPADEEAWARHEPVTEVRKSGHLGILHVCAWTCLTDATQP
jgi:hypothetical protein